ncbi:MAG: hypothetical protein WD645_03935, partial [Dehalococcoidia bacterium]
PPPSAARPPRTAPQEAARQPLRLIQPAQMSLQESRTQLVKASGKHFGTDREAHAVPVALTDHELATLLWLKSPTPRPDLPWKQVVADCRAALNPNDALWNQYLQELAVLEARADIDPEMYYIARFSNEARRELMGRTHGDPGKIDSRTVAEILAATREEMTAPHRQQLSAVEQEKARAQAALSDERAGREAAEQEKLALLGQVEKFQAADKEKDGQIDALAQDLANTKLALRRGVAVATGVIAVMATAAVVLWLPLVVASDQRWLIGAGGIIMSVSAAFAIRHPKRPQIWFGVFVPAVVMILPPLLSTS